MWIECLHPREKMGTDIQGYKVSAYSCLSCSIFCKQPSEIIRKLLLEMVDPGDIRLSDRAKLNCPIKSRHSTNCNARRTHCAFNIICPLVEDKRMQKMIRWRKVMIYVVKYNNGEQEVIQDKSELDNLDIGSVDTVYKVKTALEITMELVPYDSNNKAVIKDLIDTYKQPLLTNSGTVDIKTFYEKGKIGHVALIPEEALKPEKRVKQVPVSKIYPDEEKISTPKQVAKKEDPEVKPVEEKQKRKRRTRAEMEAARAAGGK